MPVGLVQLKIQIPTDVKKFLQAQSEENRSSQSSEVVRAVRAAMKAKGPAEAATSPSQDQNHNPSKDGGIDARA